MSRHWRTRYETRRSDWPWRQWLEDALLYAAIFVTAAALGYFGMGYVS